MARFDVRIVAGLLKLVEKQNKDLRDEVVRLTKALLYVDYCLAQPGDDETPANQYVPSRAEIESCTRVVQAALTPQGKGQQVLKSGQSQEISSYAEGKGGGNG